MSRADYVASLRVERAAIAARPASHPERSRRLADIDAELDRYAEEPAERRQEVAVAPPVEPAAPVGTEPVVAPEPAAAPVAKKATARRPRAKK
jgi:hypothetical protein